MTATAPAMDGAGSPLFADLRDLQVQQLLALGQKRVLLAGEPIFALGDAAKHLYVIARGSVALTLPLQPLAGARQLTVAEESEGSILGWAALVAPHKYALGAQAITDVALLALDGAVLLTFLRQHPKLHAALMTNLASAMGRRLNRLQTITMHTLRRDLERRGLAAH